MGLVTGMIGKGLLGVCIEMLLTDRPFEERIRTAARLGFRQAEMWLIDGSYRGTPEALAATTSEAGMTLTNTVVGTPDGSIGGGLTDPSKRGMWLDRVRLTFDFNRRAGIKASIVCTGNVVDGMTRVQMRASVVEGLARTAELADAAGIDLLLEPLNTTVDHPGYFLTGIDEAAALCREVGSARLKVLYDCYHAQIMEGNLIDRFERNLDVVGHVHLAGVPGRHEPERGEIAYPILLGRFVEAGYRGAFGLEYTPLDPHEESLTRTAAYLAGEEARP